MPATKPSPAAFWGDAYTVLANYLVVQAWLTGADCIVVGANSLRAYFGVERLQDDRVARLLRAAKRGFPHQRRMWENPDQHSNVELFLSRVGLPPTVFEGTTATARRMELLALAVTVTRVEFDSEAEIRSQLRLFGLGQALPGARAGM